MLRLHSVAQERDVDRQCIRRRRDLQIALESNAVLRSSGYAYIQHR